MIRKTSNGYSVVSEKKHNGKHKNLGTYSSKDGAKHRLAQIEYFKRIKGKGK